MIKEYFTDGLIGLAILLSLFRTDLVNINNLINYPEVQDVISGQTAAYLPVNFHNNHIDSPFAYSNQKLIDFDNQAFSAWCHNVQNLPRFRERRENEIEAFLVNVAVPPPSTVITGSHYTAETEVHTSTDVEAVPEISSPTLPLEGANSFETVTTTVVVGASGLQDEEEEGEEGEKEAPLTDVTVFFTNPFPGCNLTKEDLDLIEVLWRQDVDLGVDKEVYDHTLRQEREKERQLEISKNQEKERAHALSKEKEERQRQEHANKWLMENYVRDGETGEWVRLQNQTLNGTNLTHGTYTHLGENEGDFMTLDAALDYISTNVDLHFLEDQQAPDLAASAAAAAATQGGLTADSFLDDTLDLQASGPVAAPQASPEIYLEHQDSLEENWNGLVDYLNMAVAANEDSEATTNSNSSNNHPVTSRFVNSSLLATPEEHLTSALALTSELSNTTSDLEARSGEYLLQNATMPTVEVANVTSDFGTLHSMESLLSPCSSNSSGPTPPSATTMDLSDDPMDWDLSDLGLFQNLTSGAADLTQSAMMDDLDLDTMDDLLLNMDCPTETKKVVEVEDSLEDSLTASPTAGLSVDGSSHQQQELSDVFDGLEGAIGGLANYSSNGGGPGVDEPRGKVSRLSESSNDSGFVYQGDFSSASPSSSSSAGSNYGDNSSGSHSPVRDSTGSGPPFTNTSSSSSSSNSSLLTARDVEVRRKGSSPAVLATQHLLHPQHHVAHNHTYNTPPGQTPREVKKYAVKEPSRKGPQSRDERRASELKIPFSLAEIIDSSVDTFNEMLTKYKLTEPQLNLIKDIRRRGKNKVAAQNCRKRKVGVIVTLADEMLELQKSRDRLVAERAQMERESRQMKEKFGHLYAHIFQSLRDEAGQPYDPNLYSLQQSSDGNVFLVPRNVTKNGGSAGGSGSSNNSSPSSTNSQDDSSSSDSAAAGLSSRKRKAFE